MYTKILKLYVLILSIIQIFYINTYSFKFGIYSLILMSISFIILLMQYTNYEYPLIKTSIIIMSILYCIARIRENIKSSTFTLHYIANNFKAEVGEIIIVFGIIDTILTIAIVIQIFNILFNNNIGSYINSIVTIPLIITNLIMYSIIHIKYNGYFDITIHIPYTAILVAVALFQYKNFSDNKVYIKKYIYDNK